MKDDILKRWCRKCTWCSTSLSNVPEPTSGGCINPNSQAYRIPISFAFPENCRFFEKNKRYKTIIITGASRGIGKAIAEVFTANPKYDLALISRHYDEVKKVVEEMKEKYPVYAYERISLPFECDIRNEARVQETFKEIYEKFGSIDILVNNAGINSRRTLNPKNPEEWFNSLEDNLLGWNEEIATNLTGVYVCSYLAAGYMLKQGSGSVINISSIKGKEPTTSPGYGASKAGVIKLTKDFAKALAPHNIRVNCITPGFIDTGMTAELPEDKQQQYKSMIPLGRFGDVKEVAKVVAFLASPDSSYITGATIDVNGGYLMD